MSGILLKTTALRTYFPMRTGLLHRTAGYVRAVDGLDLEILEGETVALVGESGCGKTTAGKSILRLIEPTGGSIQYREQRDIRRCGAREMKALRREMQIVYQDPYGAMNPKMTVAGIVGEGPQSFGLAQDKKALRRLVTDALDAVQISSTALDRYIHEFSGGQRQRISIARALAVKPSFIILDEAVSALDVSIRAQILNLLNALQDQFSLTYLLITHDLSVVRYIADRVLVMYLGKIVEEGGGETLFDRPAHPYTQALMKAIPSLDPSKRKGVAAIQGDVPSPAKPPSGCRFHPRCPHAMPICSREEPPFFETPSGDRAACFLLKEIQ